MRLDELGDVLRRLTNGECYLSSDNRTSLSGCDQYIFWQNARGFQVFWNREYARPQRLFVRDATGFAMCLRIGFTFGVPPGIEQPRACLPATVVAGTMAHASARDRIVADLTRNGATWLALAQHEAWGAHLWRSPSGTWLSVETRNRRFVGMDDESAVEVLDHALMVHPESAPAPAEAELLAAALELDAAVVRAEAALAEGRMLFVAPWGGLTRVFLREGEGLYHVAIDAGRALSGSLRPLHRGEIFQGVQEALATPEPVPPALREDVRELLRQPPFAPRH